MIKRRSETYFIYLVLEGEKAQEDHDDDFGIAEFDDPTPCHSDNEGDNEGPIGDIDPLKTAADDHFSDKSSSVDPGASATCLSDFSAARVSMSRCSLQLPH